MYINLVVHLHAVLHSLPWTRRVVSIHIHIRMHIYMYIYI